MLRCSAARLAAGLNPMADSGTPGSTAELLLQRMKALGVDYVFGNAGTDFPSFIEAFARVPESGLGLPQPILVAHETVAVGMAHGYYLASGRAQTVMVHVNVGLANALMGVLNAAADNVPLLMCSGRTPLTERGRPGSRSRPIHWGQEMRDQSAMIREAVKWDYELRYPEQAALIVQRALAVTGSDPMGPVYLSLPREVVAEPVSGALPLDTRQQPVKAGTPRAEAVAEAVELLRSAAHPVIVAQRPVGSDDGRALAAFAERFAIPVVDFWASRNVMGTDHPLFAGGDAAVWLADADVIITVEALVPWLIDQENAPWDARIIAIGPDPLFTRTPLRSFPVDVALGGAGDLAIDALSRGLIEVEDSLQAVVAERRERCVRLIDEQRATALARAQRGNGSPMSPAWVSLCLSQAKDADAAVFNELGCDPSVMHFAKPETLFSTSFSGGLGWGLPAALGYQLADRERLVIACIGDGSHIFANPVACHHVAMAERLPVLTVVFNNGIWGAVRRATLAMYPQGAAARSNAMPLTQLTPSPDYAAVARAHGLWAEQVLDGTALPDAIERAVAAIRNDRVPALLDVSVAI
jgi:acetolactate synthase-1/2/3 large subunit